MSCICPTHVLDFLVQLGPCFCPSIVGLHPVKKGFVGYLQTLPAKGAHHAVRGQTLMAAIKNPEMPQASAATAASNAAGKLHLLQLVV